MLMLGAATGAAVFQATTSRFILRAGGCGFDGEQYCAMAQGRAAMRPYNRRPLLPWLVRAEHLGTALQRFLITDLIAIVSILALAYVLTRRLGGSPGQALTVSSLALLNPWTLHITLSYPALTDELSLALGLAWLLVALEDGLRWWSLPLATATVLAREQWAVPLCVAAVVLALLARSARVWVWTMTSIAVIAITTGVDFLQPYSAGPSFGIVSTVHGWLASNFDNLHGFVLFAWFLLVGLGLVPLLLLRTSRGALSRRDTLVVLGTALSQLALSTVGGGDTNRLVLPAFVLLSSVALSRLRTSVADLLAAAAACTGTVLMFRPWSVIHPDVRDFIAGWSQRYAPWPGVRQQITQDLKLVALPFLVLVASMVAAMVQGRHEHPLVPGGAPLAGGNGDDDAPPLGAGRLLALTQDERGRP
jgi:hypothetical protein